MAFLYPIIITLIIGDSKIGEYFTTPVEAFSSTYSSLAVVDIIILLSGFIGTIVSGIVIKMLRKSGYQMF